MNLGFNKLGLNTLSRSSSLFLCSCPPPPHPLPHSPQAFSSSVRCRHGCISLHGGWVAVSSSTSYFYDLVFDILFSRSRLRHPVFKVSCSTSSFHILVNGCNLACTKNIGLCQNDLVVKGCTLAYTCLHPYRSAPPPSLHTNIMLMHRPSERMHFSLQVKLRKCTLCAETVTCLHFPP